MNSAAGQTANFGSKVGGAFRALGAATLVAGTAVAGFASVVGVKSVKAAVAAQEANDKLTQAFKNQGLAITASSPAVLKLEADQRKLGVSNADTRESLLKLINSGKDYKLSVDEMGVALNLARVSGQSLGDATKSLVTLQTGSTKAAKQYGIVLPPVTAAVDKLKASHVDLTTEEGRHVLALAKVQDKLATGRAYYDALKKKIEDQGKAFAGTAAGGMAQFKAQLGDLEENIGKAFLPALSRAVSAAADFMTKLNAAPTFTAKVKVVFETAANAFTSIRKSISRELFGGSSGRAGAGFGGMTVQINQGLVSKIQGAFEKLDWTSVGKSVIDGLTNALKSAGNLAKQLASTITKAIDAINWVEVGKIMGPGLAAALVTAFVTLLDPAFWVHNWELALSVLLVAFGGTFGRAGGKLALLLRKPFEDAVLSTAGVIARVSPKLAEAVMVGLQKLPGLIGEFFGRIGATLEGFVRGLFGRLGGLAVFAIKVLGVDVAIHALEAFATGPVWNLIRTAFTTLQTVATTTWNAITAGVRTFATTLTAAMTTAWTAVRTATTTALTALTTAVTTAFTTMRTAVTTGMTAIGTAMTTAWSAVKTAASAVWNFIVNVITGAIGRATSAATAVGAGILHGVSNGLTGLVKMVQGWFQTLWAWIAGAARSAYAFALNVGKQLVQGILDGLSSAAKKLWDAAGGLVDGVRKKLEFWHSPPSEYGKWLGTELVKGITDALKGGAGAAGNAAGNFVTSIKGPLLKGMNTVGQLIVAAAKKYGVDARAALAVAMGEGGIKFGAVGDSGHAFGPFQMNNAGGVLTGMDSAAASKYANSVEGINAALRGMREAGAAGKVGLDAITTIISKYERPLNVAASIQNAIAAYKTLGPGIASAVASGAPAVSGAIMRQLTGLAALVRQYAPIIGLEHARGIVAGLVAGTPTLVQQARAQMVAAAAAARQAVVDAKGAFVSAFNDLANAALTAFDTRWAAWVPPAQRLLDKMQLAEQVKQVQDQLATAMTAVTGGGAFDASALSKQLGDALASAMSTALGSIAGAKTEEALNRVSAQVQAQVLAAIDQTSAAAMAQAQAAVAAAQTALTAAQVGGDPDAIAAAQAALDTAVGNQRALEAAILAEKELALGQLVAAEAKRHAAVGAVQREGLAQQLKEEFDWLSKHPAQWAKMGADVQKILSDYNVKLVNAGTAWANKFGDGITAGIPAAVAAARALAAAVAAVLPSTSSPLKPAKTGPLSFHPRDMGKAWASNFASGLASGRMGDIVGSIAGAPRVGGGGLVAAGAGGGGITVNVYNAGSVVTENELQESIYRSLERRAKRNSGLAFGT